MESGHEVQAARLKGHSEKTSAIIQTLGLLEKEVLDAQVHRAIALLKAVIVGKRTREEFEQQCLKIQGLL
jgi:hypothetical protein